MEEKYKQGLNKKSKIAPISHRSNRYQQKDNEKNDFDAHDQSPPKKREFTNRCKLYIGNFPSTVDQDDIKKLFTKYGEMREFWLSTKGFAFLKLDTRANAEKARDELNGKMFKSRPLRVRFAELQQTALRLKELSPYVSNELLEQAFSIFGLVESAVHICDAKGTPTGEGIVEFERKSSAAEALRRINEGVFFLTATPHPIIAEPLEQRDEDEGLPEKSIPSNMSRNKELEMAPRFATPNSFEFDFGLKWKDLYQMEAQRRLQMEREFQEIRQQLEADMDISFQDFQTRMMKEELRRRQEELEMMENQQAARMIEMQRREDERRLRIMGAGGGVHGGMMGPPGPPSGAMGPKNQVPPSLHSTPDLGPDSYFSGSGDMGYGQPPPSFMGHQGGTGNSSMMGDVKKLMQMMNKEKKHPNISPMHRGGKDGYPLERAFSTEGSQPSSSRLGSGYIDYGGPKRKRY